MYLYKWSIEIMTDGYPFTSKLKNKQILFPQHTCTCTHEHTHTHTLLGNTFCNNAQGNYCEKSECFQEPMI